MPTVQELVEEGRRYHRQRRIARSRRYDEGKYRFSNLAYCLNSMNKKRKGGGGGGGGGLQQLTSGEIKAEFYKRHPDMIFHEEGRGGQQHLMTLTSGPNQISIDSSSSSINDRLATAADGYTLENIRFIPLKLNVPLRASPSEIEQHREATTRGFVPPATMTREVYLIVRRGLYGVRRASSKRSSSRGITLLLDPSLTIERLVHKLLHDQKMQCALSGLVMLATAGSPFTLSLDRICNTLGYTYENTQFVCRFKQCADGMNVRKRMDESAEETDQRRKRVRFV